MIKWLMFVSIIAALGMVYGKLDAVQIQLEIFNSRSKSLQALDKEWHGIFKELSKRCTCL